MGRKQCYYDIHGVEEEGITYMISSFNFFAKKMEQLSSKQKEMAQKVKLQTHPCILKIPWNELGFATGWSGCLSLNS